LFIITITAEYGNKTAKLNVKNFYRSLTTAVRAQTSNRHKTANQLIPVSIKK